MGAVVAFAMSIDPTCAQSPSFGQRIYQDKADCQFCHGPDGDGRGDPRSPGKAPDLRKTALVREQLIDVIACGRPATEMPHFDKYAYEDKSCYGPVRCRGWKEHAAGSSFNTLDATRDRGSGGLHSGGVRGQVTAGSASNVSAGNCDKPRNAPRRALLVFCAVGEAGT
jgi:hypothetical protein